MSNCSSFALFVEPFGTKRRFRAYRKQLTTHGSAMLNEAFL
jgi:hypothetical protein